MVLVLVLCIGANVQRRFHDVSYHKRSMKLSNVNTLLSTHLDHKCWAYNTVMFVGFHPSQ